MHRERGSLNENVCILEAGRVKISEIFAYVLNGPPKLTELIIIEHLSRSKSTPVSSEIF